MEIDEIKEEMETTIFIFRDEEETRINGIRTKELDELYARKAREFAEYLT